MKFNFESLKGVFKKAQNILGGLPQNKTEKTARDLYDLISSPKTAQALSSLFGDFDEAKIQESINSIMMRLQDPEVLEQVAKQIKQILATQSPEDIRMMLEDAAGKLPEKYKYVVAGLLSQVVEPALEAIKASNDDQEAAQVLANLIGLIPADLISAIVAGQLRPLSPQGIAETTNGLIAKLPSPQALSDIVDKAKEMLKDSFNAAKNSGKPSEISQRAKETLENIKKMAKDTIARDKANKDKFDSNGGSFEL